jgi:predicted RNA-binding protein with PIN domain
MVRQQLRGFEAAAASAEQSTREAHQEAVAAARGSEAETRRLRSRIADLESQLAVSRRADRETRDTETMRLRLLLDTVVDAATGLRRELALPPPKMSPADTVTAGEASNPAPINRVGRGLLDEDPELLRLLLDVPRVHLIVDGYNVSKSAWPATPLDQQRARLTSKVAALVAPKRVETTLVFDGAELLDRPSVTAPRGIRVRFSPAGVIADDLIRELVSTEPPGRPVVVISSDRELAESVVAKGARSVASRALIGVLSR